MRLHSYACSQYSDDTSLVKEFMRLKSTARMAISPINGHVSVTKASLHIGGHQLQFELERDRLWQVYLPETRYMSLNTFNPDMWRELIIHEDIKSDPFLEIIYTEPSSTQLNLVDKYLKLIHAAHLPYHEPWPSEIWIFPPGLLLSMTLGNILAIWVYVLPHSVSISAAQVQNH